MAVLLVVLCLAAGGVFAAIGIVAAVGTRRLPTLEPLDQAPIGAVRVVVPARDAAAELGATLAGLSGQRGVELHVVVVDDRSTDATPAVVDAAIARDARISRIRVDSLPADWLGKCHACWTGASAAGPDHDWLLFVDADSRLGPDVVARALRVAERTGAGHVCLLPQLAGQTVWGRAATLGMCTGLVLQAAGIERDRGRGYMGVGAFTLVRRDAYDAVDGHRALRMEVLEDIGLAFLCRRAGVRARVRFAARDFAVTWITSLGSVIRLLEKNYFATRGFRTVPFAAGLALASAAYGLALFGPWLAPGLPGLAGPAGLAVFAAGTVPIARRYGWSAVHAALVVPTIPVVLCAMGNSMVRILRRGGVVWRDTCYPLAALRAGCVRRRDRG